MEDIAYTLLRLLILLFCLGNQLGYCIRMVGCSTLDGYRDFGTLNLDVVGTMAGWEQLLACQGTESGLDCHGDTLALSR
jgi:hypothetical protein